MPAIACLACRCFRVRSAAEQQVASTSSHAKNQKSHSKAPVSISAETVYDSGRNGLVTTHAESRSRVAETSHAGLFEGGLAAPACSGEPFFFSSEPLFPPPAPPTTRDVPVDEGRSTKDTWVGEQVRGKEYMVRFEQDPQPNVHIESPRSEDDPGRHRKAAEETTPRNWNGRESSQCGASNVSALAMQRHPHSMELPRVVGWDVEARRGMMVRLSPTGAAAFDEIMLNLSRGGPGVITKVLNGGMITKVLWLHNSASEHCYRTGRFGKYELMLVPELSTPRKSDPDSYAQHASGRGGAGNQETRPWHGGGAGTRENGRSSEGEPPEPGCRPPLLVNIAASDALQAGGRQRAPPATHTHMPSPRDASGADTEHGEGEERQRASSEQVDVDVGSSGAEGPHLSDGIRLPRHQLWDWENEAGVGSKSRKTRVDSLSGSLGQILSLGDAKLAEPSTSATGEHPSSGADSRRLVMSPTSSVEAKANVATISNAPPANHFPFSVLLNSTEATPTSLSPSPAAGHSYVHDETVTESLRQAGIMPPPRSAAGGQTPAPHGGGQTPRLSMRAADRAGGSARELGGASRNGGSSLEAWMHLNNETATEPGATPAAYKDYGASFGHTSRLKRLFQRDENGDFTSSWTGAI